MLVKNLPFDALPHIELEDPVYRVLALMQDNNVLHIAVTHEDKFYGLIGENDLLEADEDSTIGELQYLLHNFSVKEDDHFLRAVALAVNHKLSIVPVTDGAGNYTGSVQSSNLLKHVADFIHLQEPGAMVVLEVDAQHYSSSDISKLVESNDAQVTQLNTSRNSENGKLFVTIKINKLEISDIVSTFQRYEYNVKYYSGEELYTNELKNNYENLMNYLNI